MSMFKKAAKALFGRPRKAVVAAAATTILVATSVLPAFATMLHLTYESDLFRSIPGVTETASLSLSADIDSDKFVSVNGVYVSYLADWTNLEVSVTTGADTYKINSSNLDTSSVASRDGNDDFMEVDANNNITAWNLDFWNQDYSAKPSGVEALYFTSDYTTAVLIADSAGSGFDRFSACDGCGIKTLHTPEPSTMVMFGVGLLGLAALGRKGFGATPKPDPVAAHARTQGQVKRFLRRTNRRNLAA